MKIVFFDQHFSTPDGATGNRSYWNCKALVEAGHEVVVLCGSYYSAKTGLCNSFKNGKREGVVNNIRIIEYDMAYSNNDSLLKRAWIFLKFALRSTAFSLKEPCDIIFATSTPLTIGIPGIIAHWFKRKPFIFEVRDLWPELPREMKVITNPLVLWMLSILEWVSYHSSIRLIGLSPGIVAGINRRGIKKENIAMIPNGCDLNIFIKNIPAYRPQEVADSDLMAIYAGTHGIANGLDAIIDTAIELQNRGNHKIKLVLVGGGKLKPKLVKRAKEEQLTNVIFLDFMGKKQLAKLMVGADLGIQCLADVEAFYYGTSPNKFFDYISAGLPVLNNYPGWLADMIKQHKCGFVVKPADANSFADTLEYAEKHREELIPMGNAAYKLAQAEFNRSNLATDFVHWLEGGIHAKT